MPRHGVVTGFAVSDELPSLSSSTSSSMPARPSPLAGAVRPPLASHSTHHHQQQQQSTSLDVPPQRSGIPCGSAACRELAAYLLDRDAFAGVPMTALAIVQVCLCECFFVSLLLLLFLLLKEFLVSFSVSIFLSRSLYLA